MKRMKTLLARLPCLCLIAALCACGRGGVTTAAGGAPDGASAAPAGADAAYEAAAQAVRDEFTQLIGTGPDDFDEAAHPELPRYTAALTRFEGNGYYEAFYDFDGNGVPEMLVGVGDESSRTVIAVYAFDGRTMRYLCKEHPLGERAYLGRADGLFVVRGSGGAAQGEYALYRIAPDGWSTEIVDVIDYFYSDEEHVSYTSQMGVVSGEELVSRGLTKAVGLDIEPEWKLFYPGEGK